MSDARAVDSTALDDLLETTGGDRAFLAELIDTYLVDSRDLLIAMRRALADGSPEVLRRAAHSLKSNSASFGAHALAAVCRDLEQRSRDGILDGAGERIDRIDVLFVEVDRELRALRPAD
jgi:HPt (histidine-containing phosphotransfer) domain-containing protein